MSGRTPDTRNGSDPAARFPASVYGVGTDPDARFSMANERTFLAWITLGLGSLSLGVGLESFALTLQPQFRLAASLVLILLGAFLPVQAWFGWKRVERALRLGRPLPSMVQGILTAGWVMLAGILIALGVLFE